MYSNPYDSYLRTLTDQVGVVPVVQPDMAFSGGRFGGGGEAAPQQDSRVPITNMNLQIPQYPNGYPINGGHASGLPENGAPTTSPIALDIAPSVAGAKVARAPGEHSTTQKLLHALLGTSFGIGG